jgi:hypothetical protein
MKQADCIIDKYQIYFTLITDPLSAEGFSDINRVMIENRIVTESNIQV